MGGEFTHSTQVMSMFGFVIMHRPHIMLWFELRIKSSLASTILEVRSDSRSLYSDSNYELLFLGTGSATVTFLPSKRRSAAGTTWPSTYFCALELSHR